MRYLVAMLFAIAAAAATAVFAGSEIANWLVAGMKFDNPDQVADTQSMIFMAVNFAGLLLGWAIGWMLGGTLEGEDDGPD